MFILLAAFFDSSSFHSLHTLHACTPKISSATSFNISHSLSTRVLHPRKIRPCLPIGVGLRWVSTLCANCLSGSLTFTVYTPLMTGHSLTRYTASTEHSPITPPTVNRHITGSLTRKTSSYARLILLLSCYQAGLSLAVLSAITAARAVIL